MRKLITVISIICTIGIIALIFASCQATGTTQIQKQDTAVQQPDTGKETSEQPPAEQETAEAKTDTGQAQQSTADGQQQTEEQKAQDIIAAIKSGTADIASVQPVSQTQTETTAGTTTQNKISTQTKTSTQTKAAAQTKTATQTKTSATAGVSISNIEKLIINGLIKKCPSAKRNSSLDQKAAQIAAALGQNKSADSINLDDLGKECGYTATYFSQNDSSSQINASIANLLTYTEKNIDSYGLGLYTYQGNTTAVVLAVYQPGTIHVEPVKVKKEIIPPTLSPDMEQKIFAEINKQRKAAGANALTLSQTATQQARAYALKMMQSYTYFPPGGMGIAALRMDKDDSVTGTVDYILRSCIDAGTYVPKDPSKGVTVNFGGDTGSGSNSDNNIDQYIPPTYTYPYLQSPDYKSVGVGVYYGTDNDGDDTYCVVVILNK